MSCHGNRPSMEGGSWAEEVKEHCDRQQDGSNNNSLENKEYKTNKNNKAKKTERRRDRRRRCRKIKCDEKERLPAEVRDSKNEMGRNEAQYHEEKETWGDEINVSTKWPNSNETQTIRILHYNAKGIASGNNYDEWEGLLNRLDEIQVDVYCLNEISIDTRKSCVQHNIREIGRLHDPHMKIVMESSKVTNTNNETIFKPGGTMVGIKGNWSGRTIIPKGVKNKDELGRWSTIHLQGRQGQIITIMSVYRVCAHSEGNRTVYIQQQVDYMNKYKKIIDPREQIIKDVKHTALEYIQNNHKVIIGVDINDDAGAEYKNRWNNMIQEIGLRNIHQSKHGGNELPRTYDRGKRCIDMIAVSENVTNKMVIRAGILPFYTLSASDHRAMYIDIDTQELFDNNKPDVTRQSFKRFTTKNVKKCDKYLHKLDQYFEQSKMYKKVIEIKKEIKTLLEAEEKWNNRSRNNINTILMEKRREIEHRLQTLDQKRWELMIAAESKCGPTPMNEKKWYSTTLVRAAKELTEAKGKVREYQNDRKSEKELEEAIKERDKKAEAFRNIQKEDRQYRDIMLEELAQKRAKAWNVTTKQAAKILMEAEKSSGMYKKIEITVKGTKKEGIKSILVPTNKNPGQKIDTDNDYNNGNWEQIRDPDDIFENILMQNAKMLARSRLGMTATGKLGKELGRDNGNQELLEKILKGKLNPAEFTEDMDEGREEAEEFIHQMKTRDGMKEMEWAFGKDEYRELFKNTRETTACGPSGLHMSHWIAALQNEYIMELHSTMTWAAFAMGITFKRWTISWHCMIKKLEEPYINKLRIIQLFEGDFNGGLKYLLGKLFMKKLIKEKSIDPSAYGSIPGKDAVEAMMALQYLYDNHRILRKDLIVVFNDAEGCYDRVRPNHSEICSLCLGCSKNIMKTHTATQNEMKHHVKTATGTSRGYIKWENIDEDVDIVKKVIDEISVYTGNIGGIGQGGGSSPVEWLAVLLIMIRTYRKFASGATVIDPTGMYSFVMAILSYVDDNSLVKSLESNQKAKKIFEDISKEMVHWRNILKLTGGDLAPQKCTVTLMKWAWSEKSDSPHMQKIKETPGTIILQSEQKEHPIELRRLEINEGMKQLGVILPIDGSFRQERDRRMKQGEDLGQRLFRSPLSHNESMVVYRMYFIPKMRYPLSITKFKQKECNDIQSKFYKYALPKMGINRNTPRAMLFGPIEMGGAGLFDIYTAQIEQHIIQITHHIRRQDQVGKAFICNLKAYETTIGSGQPLFDLNPWKYCYGEKNSTIFFLWRISRFWKLNVTVKYNHNMNQSWRNKKTIMDIAVNDQILKGDEKRLRSINACRLYHGVIDVHEMSHYTGEYITEGYLYGRGSYRRKEHNGWPTQPLPLDYQWDEWRKFVRRNFLQENSNRWKIKRSLNKLNSKCTMTPKNRIQMLLDNSKEIKRDPTVEQLINELPEEYQVYIQLWNVEKESTTNILRTALNKETLHVATDGSHIPGTEDGAAAAIARDENETDHSMWVGCKCAIEEGMTSQTTEHYGVINGLLMIYILVKKSKMEKGWRPSIKFWIDNAEVLTRARKYNETRISLKQFSVRDYAHQEVMRQLISVLQQWVRIEFLKVKSHQQASDDQPIEVMMNDDADQLANTIRTTFIGPINRYIAKEHDGILLTNKNRIKRNNIQKWVRTKIKGEELQMYLKRRNTWSQETINMIAFEDIGEYLKSKKPEQQLSLLQLIHNWQNTGEQKEKFLHSKLQQQQITTEDEIQMAKEELKHAAQCPMKCGERETHLHFMTCKNEQAHRYKKQLIETCKKHLTKKNIYTPITSLLINGLNWTDDHKLPTYSIRMTRADILISKAIDEQTNIGWSNLRRGMISKQWIIAQQIFIDETKAIERYNWGKLIIGQILNVSWGMWEWRNKILHGISKKDLAREKKALMHQKVDNIYKKLCNGQYTQTNKTLNIFGENRNAMKKTIKKRDMEWIESWISMAEEELAGMDKRDKNTIDSWIIRESTKLKHSK